jgi:hypothetical protein
MCYEPRKDFDSSLNDLHDLLTSASVDPELANYARALILQRPLKLLRCVIGGGSAVRIPTDESPSGVEPLFEPSDIYFALFSALAANSFEAVKAIAHEFFPPDASALPFA